MPRKSVKRAAILASLASILLASACPVFAQDWRGGGGDHDGPPMRLAFRDRGRWWNNPAIAQQIGLTDDQKKKMDDIFQQHRLKLIDLDAAVRKQEVVMQPMIEADQPDEAKILAQIDAIAQARADLEKENARMLFGIRSVLTPDQWKKAKTLARERGDRGGPGMRDRRGGPGGPNGGPGQWKRNGPNSSGGPNGAPGQWKRNGPGNGSGAGSGSGSGTGPDAPGPSLSGPPNGPPPPPGGDDR
jgi:protein CpxP